MPERQFATVSIDRMTDFAILSPSIAFQFKPGEIRHGSVVHQQWSGSLRLGSIWTPNTGSRILFLGEGEDLQ